MTFTSIKEIPPDSGNWYDYEVNTVHEGKKVNLCQRKSVKKGYPVVDATLTPINQKENINGR